MNYPSERTESENDYLKRYFSEFYDNSGQNVLPEASKNHPNYAELEQKHGKIDINTLNVQQRTKVDINLEHWDGKTKNKKLPLTIEIKKLKILVNKLFKIPSPQQNYRLILVQQNAMKNFEQMRHFEVKAQELAELGMPDSVISESLRPDQEIKIELDSDQKSLDFYTPFDGDKILIHPLG